MKRTHSESDVMWTKMYLSFGGFTYECVARYVFHDKHPADKDVAWVGKLAREEGLSSMEWRRGESDSAKGYLRRVEKGGQSRIGGS